LIHRVQAGDLEAFAELMGLHVRRVRRFVALNLPVPHLIDEITHETFIFAFQNLGKFKPDGSFGGWLSAIAGNLVRAELQRFRREQENQKKYTDLRVIDTLTGRPPDTVSRESDLLETCLQKVPGKFRGLLDLKYKLALSTEEIAANCKQSPAWVRTTLFRLRQQLRDCLTSRLNAGS
jgi:RNA polymerase sigma-70 factor (ECF subfamily)